MSRTWLTAILIALAGWCSASAQERRVQYSQREAGDTWAANRSTLKPVAAINTPIPANQVPPSVNYYLTPKNAPLNVRPANTLPPNSPVNAAPPAAMGAPHACNTCAPLSGCGKGGCGSKFDWSRLFAWVCYQPMRGGCSKHGSCGCNCSTPLYLYFVHDCGEGRKYELPACACKERPGVAAQLVEGTKTLFHSAGAAISARSFGVGSCAGSCAPSTGSCGPTNGTSSSCAPCSGHRLFGQPTGNCP